MNRRKVGPDFHLVELTAEGRDFAKGAPLRISNGRISVLFPADGEPVKVARFEWDMLLREHSTICGRRLFQVCCEPAPESSIEVSLPKLIDFEIPDETKENV